MHQLSRAFHRLMVPIILFAVVLSILTPILPTPVIAQTEQPQSVTIAGTIQALLGCPSDWQPECDVTFLTYDEVSDLWLGSWELPAGDYEYKAALNGSWTENYGLNAEPSGPNIPLSLAETTTVTFYYSHNTHWITDNVNSIIATVPGSYQSELGCPDTNGNGGDWEPACLLTWLQDPDGDGVYTFTAIGLPEGSFEAKVAVNLSWDENYGLDGAPGGANIPFATSADPTVFEWDSNSKVMTIVSSAEAPTTTGTTALPQSVAIAGTVQSVLGCPGDWQPECEATFLTYDETSDLWSGSWELPAGDYEYKAALNGGWAENYGLNALRDGPNIPLSLAEATTVTFYYSHNTHWITDNVNSIIATVPGSYQSEVGCPDTNGNGGDWEPACLLTWLQDPDGDGIYTYSASGVPEGAFEAKVAVNLSWDENYGADGAPGGGNIAFTSIGKEVLFEWNSETKVMVINAAGAPKGNLSMLQAHWVTPDTIAWDVDAPEGSIFTLYYAPDGGLTLTSTGVTGGESFPLTVDEAGLSEAVLAKFPHLEGALALKLSDAARIPELLKGQVAVGVIDPDGNALDATGLQIPGVLDELYTYDGKLGPVYSADGISISVWAPTARNVTLHIFADSAEATTSTTSPMTLDPATGVWTATGSVEDWNGKFYLYEVEVYVPKEGAVVKNLVTDPYSVSLSTNSTRSQIVDLSDPSLAPTGWVELQKPPLAAPEDIVLYELHVRDFSVSDPAVPDELKGTYKAFTLTNSNGMQHLIALAQAGLTHIHLLPVFDIATINEDRAAWVGPTFEELAGFGPAASNQQELIDATRDQDGFNWGYDPYHYSVPEGSYSTNPDGTTRIVEFREMVQALNQNGLRVVMDVVYNHTNSSGQNEKSVLDRIVPGYYHRLDDNGTVATSTCCANTATEHNMMEKLMIDSVVMWATQYKVDGFRFDLMGHHMRTNMEHVRAALDALTIENSGVDGKSIYLYGEGWDFGEVAQNARGINATQLNMGGTGIGTFNDRLRDAVRGGSPFGGFQDQGFVSGLSLEPNGVTDGTPEEQAARLLHFADQIKVGLAGNLRDYTVVNAEGETVTGAEIDYNGNPTGYTLDPQEHIVYAEAHDNQTLFDLIQYKAPEAATVADRVRMQNLGIDIVALSQGVPFFHAGMDMLRSKSMDKNSYNSGDWFNVLDFTYQTNNWAVGLPPEGDNGGDWPVIQPLLENPNIVPGPDDIMNTVLHFREMLQIRKSSSLFRLQTAAQIQEQVRFFNNGPEQMPGVIVMQIVEGSGGDIDPNYDMVVVIFNATGTDITYTEAQLAGLTLQLHPVQAASTDPIVQGSAYDSASGTFTIPARTTAVFVMPAQ